MRRTAIAGLLAAALSIAPLLSNAPTSSTATAAPGPGGATSGMGTEQMDRLTRISNYVNSITHLRGSFTQVGPNGEFSEGKFYLQRPGKLRFEYSAPNPLLVVSDGRWVGIEDRRMKTTDKYPLSATPLRLLLDEAVNLETDARVISLVEMNGFISLTLEDKRDLAPGQLTLVFSATDLSLRQWVVLDAQGLRTEVSIFDVVAGVPANSRLFWINDNNVLDVGRK